MVFPALARNHSLISFTMASASSVLTTITLGAFPAACQIAADAVGQVAALLSSIIFPAASGFFGTLALALAICFADAFAFACTLAFASALAFALALASALAFACTFALAGALAFALAFAFAFAGALARCTKLALATFAYFAIVLLWQCDFDAHLHSTIARSQISCVWKHICSHTHTSGTHKQRCSMQYTSTHAVQTHTWTYANLHVRTCICTYMHVGMCACVCICCCFFSTFNAARFIPMKYGVGLHWIYGIDAHRLCPFCIFDICSISRNPNLYHMVHEWQDVLQQSHCVFLSLQFLQKDAQATRPCQGAIGEW